MNSIEKNKYLKYAYCIVILKFMQKSNRSIEKTSKCEGKNLFEFSIFILFICVTPYVFIEVDYSQKLFFQWHCEGICLIQNICNLI